MRDFLKYATASAIGTIVGLIALMAVLGLSLGSLFAFLLVTASRDSDPQVQDGSILVFDLSTEITDSVPPAGASAVLGETLANDVPTLSTYSVLAALERAAEDDRIVGLYLRGNSNEGFATLRELRQALETFRDSGKPIFAYAMGWSERDYYLTANADTLWLNPAGLLEFNGFRAEIQFLAGALDKYGIGVQALQAGRYKSAIEPFVRTDSSPELRQQTEALLADFWQEFLGAVHESREVAPSQLQQLADAGGLLMAAEAETAGLIDQVAYYDDVLAELRQLTDAEADEDQEFPQIDLGRYSRVATDDPAARFGQNQIAVLYAEGDIVSGEGDVGLIGAESFSRTLRDLSQDDAIQAVVLRINSPGGGASASEAIAREVNRLRQHKPVIVSMGDVAASGGYMMASEADQIFASPNTITGSIGVFGLVLNFQEIGNNNGITWDILKTARFADIDSLARPQTDEELALQQAIVDTLYDRFITRVADSRELAKEAVDRVAQGRVWSGQDAQAAQLVDEVGGLMAAIKAAAEAAALEDWRVVEYPRPRSLEEEILDTLFGGQLEFRSSDPLTQEMKTLYQQLQSLQHLNDPHGIYMRLPFMTEIQ